MAKVHLIDVVVLDTSAPFDSPFQFEITFECLEDLKEDLEWKLIYVGSADSEEYDQILDCVYVGPVPEGRHMFCFQADPPDPSKIPVQDVVGVTVILLSCSYRGKEFIRVGYYINNEYVDDELKENPPAQPQFDKLQRHILATYPRVTRFKIDWCDSNEENGECHDGDDGVDDHQEPENHHESPDQPIDEGEDITEGNGDLVGVEEDGEEDIQGEVEEDLTKEAKMEEEPMNTEMEDIIVSHAEGEEISANQITSH